MVVGDKCTVKVYPSSSYSRKKPRVYTGEIVYIHPDDLYITVDVGSYKLTVLKADRLTGKVQLFIDGQLVKVEKERRIKEVVRKPVIEKDLLLEECRIHGTNAAAMKTIANKYNVAISTVRNASYRWDIKLKLQEEEKKEEQNMVLYEQQYKDQRDEDKQNEDTKEIEKISGPVPAEIASTETKSNDRFEVKYIGLYTAVDAAVVMVNTAEMLEGLARGKEDERYHIHLAVSR
jgi:hypothetical protein